MNESIPPVLTADPTVLMKQLVLEIVQALVDNPDSVSIDLTPDGEGPSTAIHLKVAPQDIGKVIGKQGRTARSLRTILGAASMKLHHRFSLDIMEERGELSRNHDSSSRDLQKQG